MDANFLFFSTYISDIFIPGDKMKKIIKSFFLPLFISIIFGVISGRYVYNSYKENIYDSLSSSRLYLVESGEYDNIQNMREDNINNNYVYYEDDNKYKTVVGITRKYDNIDKIKSLYDSELKVYEYYISKSFLDSRQDEYDMELSKVSDKGEVKKVVDDILKLYRDNDDIRLVSVN